MPRRLSPRRRPWLVLGLPLALLLLVAGLFGLRLWVYHYLRSDDFRRALDREASAALRADARFDALHWEDAEAYTGAFDATGQPANGAPLARLAAEQIRARLDLRALWRGAWRVESVDLERLDATLAAPDRNRFPRDDAVPAPSIRDGRADRERRADEYSATPRGKGGFLAGLLPHRVEIGAVRVNDFSLAWNADRPADAGRAQGVRVTARPEPGSDDLRAWRIEGEGGRVAQAHFPAVRLGALRLKVNAHEVFVTRAEGQPEVGGHIELAGHQSLDGDRALDLAADFDNLPASAFLPPDWRARVRGQARGSVRVTNADGQPGGVRATGHAELREGRLTNLPVLSELAMFTRSDRLRQMELQKAQADFEWSAGTLRVSGLLAESEGLGRVEGGFTVRDGQVDGAVQFGLARGVLRWLPGAGARVFSQPERDGYVWTTVRLAGPTNHPSEDLSPRLLAATQEEIIEKAKQGTTGVLDTAKGLLDLLH